tara:strand:- start:261 stop:467 length:207 start_codon:yes stop_codon:yes gene_type:complete
MTAINQFARDDYMKTVDFEVEVDTRDLCFAVEALCERAQTHREKVRSEFPALKEAADKLSELIIVLEG